jgi:hypothetical protein
MTQAPLIPFDRPELFVDDVSLLAAYRSWRRASGTAPATVAAEVSQLRSLSRSAVEAGVTGLGALRDDPATCAKLIEAAGPSLSLATVRTRVRAFTNLLKMDTSLAPEAVRERIQSFRDAFPRGASLGWHDSGVSLPGRRSSIRLPGPTPGPSALEDIVRTAESRSALEGALAALLCFSALDLQSIATLRWTDLTWQDEADKPYWTVRSARRNRETELYLVGPGARALLRWALMAGQNRQAFVFAGRRTDSLVSTRALRKRTLKFCTDAGWPRVTRPQLLGAFVGWLSTHGVDDHAIRLTIGRRRVASVDRLRSHSRRIDAQLEIDDQLWRGLDHACHTS